MTERGYLAGMAIVPSPSPSSNCAYSPAAGSPIRVVLADDQLAVRRGLRLRLESERDVEVIAEAGDLSTAIRHVKGHVPHVLVLDLRMPGGPSVEAIGRLRAEVPETEIVVYTTEDSPVFAQQAIDAGAVGYVLKDGADGELSHAVRCAARGEAYVSSRVVARLDALRRAVDVDGLSPRETEVLRLIGLGLTSGEISEKLHLSPRTVETHRRRIHRKLGLGKRSALVRYALACNLIGDPQEIA
jgi:two-component system, NarL family, response regulator NreC